MESKWLLLGIAALFFIAWGAFEALAPAGCEGHWMGESWPAGDGCNTCTCEPDGIACTELCCDAMEACADQCGDGVCQEVVCEAIGCPCAETAESCPEDCGSAGLANPASVNCEDKGGELEFREGEGGTYGVCILPDGECEEWAFYRGECDPARPEVEYCYDNGGVIEERLDEEEVTHYYCVLQEGECEARAFYDGECEA